MALAGRDGTLLVLIEHAQPVYLLTRYPKKRVPTEGHAMIPRDELAQTPNGEDLMWQRAKRIAPTVIRDPGPLLEGEPEAAFFLRPEEPKKRSTGKKPAPEKAATRARASGGRRSANGMPSR